MNWEAVGAIGEIAGALGVIVTLIYLAFQVRQNTRSSQLSSFQTSTEMLNLVSTTIAADDDLAEILSRIYAGDNEEISPSQRIKFTFLTLSLFRTWETAYFQRREGMALQQSWQRYEGSIRSQMLHPAVQEWWVTGAFGFTEEFRAYIDSVREEIGGGT